MEEQLRFHEVRRDEILRTGRLMRQPPEEDRPSVAPRPATVSSSGYMRSKSVRTLERMTIITPNKDRSQLCQEVRVDRPLGYGVYFLSVDVKSQHRHHAPQFLPDVRKGRGALRAGSVRRGLDEPAEPLEDRVSFQLDLRPHLDVNLHEREEEDRDPCGDESQEYDGADKRADRGIRD